MLNITLNLKSLLGRGPGRRRLPAAYATAQARIAELEAAAETAQVQHEAEIKGLNDALQEAARKYNGLCDSWRFLRAGHETQGRELAQLRTLLAASDGRPGVDVPAPVDQGCRDTPHAAAETIRDLFHSDFAEPGEHGLAADLNARRDAWDGGAASRPPLPGEAITQEIAIPLGSAPFAKSTVPAEVSPTAGDRAQQSVLAAVGSPQ